MLAIKNPYANSLNILTRQTSSIDSEARSNPHFITSQKEKIFNELSMSNQLHELLSYSNMNFYPSFS